MLDLPSSQAIILLLNGIAFGTVLFLLASGLSLTFGLMRILNLAHGALYMVGAYVGWSLVIEYRLNFWLAALLAALAAGVVGLVIERFLRPLRESLNEQVLLTLGFVYILTNLCQWVWGPTARTPFTAPDLAGSVSIAGWDYPRYRIGIIILGLILAAILWWIQEKTRVGAMVRAGIDDKEMATGIGLNVGRVNTLVFLVSSCVAGMSGLIGAQLFGVNLDLGFDILLLAVVVVIVGGLGSIQGALIGGMLIGVIDSFGKVLLPDATLFLTYLVMIVVLLVKPSGLLGRPL
jgi:branched-chain amino acid transport system permease protein